MGLTLEYEMDILKIWVDPEYSIQALIRSPLFKSTLIESKSLTWVDTIDPRSKPTWFPLMSLNSTSIRVSNSTATNPGFEPWLNPMNPPAAPLESSSGDIIKASPPPMEEGFRFVILKEKKVVKLAGELVPGRRNFTGRE